MTEKSEKVIQGEIMHALSMNGCTVFRTNAGKVRLANGGVVELLPKGHPDIAGFRKSDGKALYVEVKNRKGRLRDEQIKFGKFLSQYPVIYGVCRSAEEALALIEEDHHDYNN